MEKTTRTQIGHVDHGQHPSIDFYAVKGHIDRSGPAPCKPPIAGDDGSWTLNFHEDPVILAQRMRACATWLEAHSDEWIHVTE